MLSLSLSEIPVDTPHGRSGMCDLTFSELLLAVLLGDLHLEYLVIADGRGHLAEALSA